MMMIVIMGLMTIVIIVMIVMIVLVARTFTRLLVEHPRDLRQQAHRFQALGGRCSWLAGQLLEIVDLPRKGATHAVAELVVFVMRHVVTQSSV